MYYSQDSAYTSGLNTECNLATSRQSRDSFSCSQIAKGSTQHKPQHHKVHRTDRDTAKNLQNDFEVDDLLEVNATRVKDRHHHPRSRSSEDFRQDTFQAPPVQRFEDYFDEASIK